MGRDLSHVPSLTKGGNCAKLWCFRIVRTTFSSNLWPSLLLFFGYIGLRFSLLWVVCFQGYKVFSRGESYWGTVSSRWGNTLGPWVVIIAFMILLFVWHLRTRLQEGRWTWHIR